MLAGMLVIYGTVVIESGKERRQKRDLGRGWQVGALLQVPHQQLCPLHHRLFDFADGTGKQVPGPRVEDDFRPDQHLGLGRDRAEFVTRDGRLRGQPEQERKFVLRQRPALAMRAEIVVRIKVHGQSVAPGRAAFIIISETAQRRQVPFYAEAEYSAAGAFIVPVGRDQTDADEDDIGSIPYFSRSAGRFFFSVAGMT